MLLIRTMEARTLLDTKQISTSKLLSGMLPISKGDPDQDKYLEAGMDGYIANPVKLDDL